MHREQGNTGAIALAPAPLTSSPVESDPPSRCIAASRPDQDSSRKYKAPTEAGAFSDPRLRGKLVLRRLGRLGGRRSVFRVLAAEALDASGGIHQLLFAGKERVAGGADFNTDVALMSRT